MTASGLARLEAFHTVEVSSSLVLTRRVPSSLYQSALTDLRCDPFRVEIRAPVLAFQIRISAFSEPVAMRSPLGLHATARHGNVWPVSVNFMMRVFASMTLTVLSARAAAKSVLVPGAAANAKASWPSIAPAGARV